MRRSMSQPAWGQDSSLNRVAEHGQASSWRDDSTKEDYRTPLGDPLAARIMGWSKYKMEDIMNSGKVIERPEGVAIIKGCLAQAVNGAVVKFPNGSHGVVLRIRENGIDVGFLDKDPQVSKHGEVQLETVSRRLYTVVGPGLLGRVVSPTGAALDDLGDFTGKVFKMGIHASHKTSPMHTDRHLELLHTGLKAVDTFYPLAKGWRTAIFGQPQMPKSEVALDILSSFVDSNGETEDAFKRMHCIYVLVGKTAGQAEEIIDMLRQTGILEFTTVVRADTGEAPLVQHYAPLAGCHMADYYKLNGMDSFVIYDNITAHHRVTSSLMRDVSGQLAYGNWYGPLLERACQLKKEAGGGSMTALCIADDGEQLGKALYYLKPHLLTQVDSHFELTFDTQKKGILPPIEILPVPFSSPKFQKGPLRELTSQLRQLIVTSTDMERSFRASAEVGLEDELDEELEEIVEKVYKIQKMFHQGWTYELPNLLLLLYGGLHKLQSVDLSRIHDFEDRLYDFVNNEEADASILDAWSNIQMHAETAGLDDLEPYFETILQSFLPKNADLQYSPNMVKWQAEHGKQTTSHI